MWPNGSASLALTAVACALLIACSGGDSRPAPTPVPVTGTPTVAGTATATAETTPSATATPSPTPIPTSTPTATAVPAPTTPTPTPWQPTPWQPTFREVPTDEVFVTRTYAPGEDFSDQVGLFFLDTETGEVEMWSLLAAEGAEQEYREVDIRASWTNRYVYAPSVPALHDRETGVTVTWSADEFDLIAQEEGGFDHDAIRRFSRLFGPFGWGSGDDETLVATVREGAERDAGVSFAVLDTELKIAASFSVPGLAWRHRDRLHLWASPDGGHVLINPHGGIQPHGGRTLYIVDLTDASHTAINVPPSSPDSSEFPRVHLHDGGFAVTGDCRITRYDWLGMELSSAEVAQGGCHFPMLSPNGEFLAMGAILVRVAWPASSAFMGMVVYDAATGEALFHARGVARPPSMLSTTPWLPDSSGLFVMVAEPPRLRLLGVDGEWLSLSPGLSGTAGVVPAPDDPAISAANLTTVVDAEGTLLAGSARPDDATNLSFLRPWSPWGANSREMRFGLPDHWWAAADGWSPILSPPVVERPPFPTRNTLEVHATGAACPRLVEDYRRPQPGDKSGPRLARSDSDPCLETGALVELTASEAEWGEINVLAWEWCQEVSDTGCLWAFVRTADGAKGWVQIDYLRWVAAER